MTSAYTPDISSISPMTTWSAAAPPARRRQAEQRAERQRLLICASSRYPFLMLIQTPKNSCSKPCLRSQFRLCELLHDLAVLHHVEAIRQRRRKPEVLFDQHHRNALCAATCG